MENHCSAGCPTPGEHTSWGACVKAKGTLIAYARSAAGWDATKEKAFQKECGAYEKALKDGLDPVTPTWGGIRKAYVEAEKKG